MFLISNMRKIKYSYSYSYNIIPITQILYNMISITKFYINYMVGFCCIRYIIWWGFVLDGFYVRGFCPGGVLPTIH